MTAIAGNGAQGFGGDGGPASAAQLNRAVYVHYDLFGNLYIAGEFNQRIRKGGPVGHDLDVRRYRCRRIFGRRRTATSAQLRGPNGIYSGGLAPGLIGLYPINFRVPQETSLGRVDLRVTANGQTSKTVQLEVRSGCLLVLHEPLGVGAIDLLFRRIV